MRINTDTTQVIKAAKTTFKKMTVEYQDNAAIDAVVTAPDGPADAAIASEIGD